MCAVDTTWTDPSTGGTIDLNTGGILTETIWDKVLSNLKRLNGTAGLLQTAANANMTIGLTIDQGAADNEIIALKSSDIAHGVTVATETDTYAYFKKYAAATGGLDIHGLGTAAIGTALHGIATSDDTTHTAAGTGCVMIDGAKKNGASLQSVGANGNILVVRNNGSTKFIVDAEGDLFNDGAALSAYDSHDDGVVAADLAEVMLGREGTTYGKEALREMGILDYGEDERPFISHKQTLMLCLGAIKQLHAEAVKARQQVADLKARTAVLEKVA